MTPDEMLEAIKAERVNIPGYASDTCVQDVINDWVLDYGGGQDMAEQVYAAIRRAIERGNGQYVMNAREDAQYVVDTIAAYQAEIAEVSGLLRALYWQLETLAPYCKHPQQLEERERARILLGISKQSADPTHSIQPGGSCAPEPNRSIGAKSRNPARTK
jgi:uncharacterized heparinase superfamily protein